MKDISNISNISENDKQENISNLSKISKGNNILNSTKLSNGSYEFKELNKEEEENEQNKKKKILLDLNEFQYKHAKKYIKRIDDKCAICLETYKGTDIVKQFACGQHIFHKKCLIILCKKSNK